MTRLMNGLKGIVGGLLGFILAATVWYSMRFVFPELAQLMLWLSIVCLNIAIWAPIYYWVGLPAYGLYRSATS